MADPKNAGKAPSEQFYYKDFFADMVEHPNHIVGAWMKILCKIWHAKNNGKVTLSIEQLNRIIGEETGITQSILDYLKTENIADIEQCNVTGNGEITIINRRAERDAKLKEQNRLRQKAYRDKHNSNAPVTPKKSNPSSSSSSSTSVNKYKEEFEKARLEYPKGKKAGLETEFKYFCKKHADWKEVVGLLYPAVVAEKAFKQSLQDSGDFCPDWKNFQSWIYNRRWEFEYDTPGDHKTQSIERQKEDDRKTYSSWIKEIPLDDYTDYVKAYGHHLDWLWKELREGAEILKQDTLKIAEQALQGKKGGVE